MDVFIEFRFEPFIFRKIVDKSNRNVSRFDDGIVASECCAAFRQLLDCPEPPLTGKKDKGFAFFNADWGM